MKKITVPKFAVAYSVKNEAQLLPKAIEYYQKIGCSHVYIFWDGTTDNSAELIREYENVTCMDSLRPDQLKKVFSQGHPSWIDSILPRWHENMDRRKRINTMYAAQMATKTGIEWLLCVDPDELLIFDLYKTPVVEDVSAFFKAISPSVDQILVRNMEVVPTSVEVENPFEESVYFLNRFPRVENMIWVFMGIFKKFFKSPLLSAWVEHYLYKTWFGGVFPQMVIAPVSKIKIPRSFYLGYKSQKSIIRCSRASLFNYDIHKWRSHEKKIRTVCRGTLLHYDLFSLDYFKKKFQQRSAGIILKVFFVRYMLAMVARETDPQEIELFYKNNIQLSETKLDALLKKGIVKQVDVVRKVLGECNV